MDDNQNKSKDKENKNIHKTKYQQLGVPGHIIIDNKTYIFKEKLKGDKDLFTYLCKNFKCRVPININLENLKKLSDKNNNENIDYIANKEHKCKSENNVKTIGPEKCTTEEQMIREARKIIKANPLESLTYHKNKLEEYNIFFTDARINHLIYDIRNEIYPADEEILKNINQITITYDDKLPNSKNLPFCPVYNKFINHCKKNRLESFIIITSFFLLKFLMNISHLFIDATFKIAPKNYYQILNIIGYDKTKNFNMPVFHIIMSNKSFESYNKIFQEILNLLDEYKIKINFKNIIINCDFEKSLINAIRNNFKEIKIYGCYFHYVKALWKKASKLGLTKAKLLNNTKLLIFSFKIYPFILNKKNKIL